MVTEPVKRLYRSQTDRVLGGVAGGLGEFLGIDTTIIRLVFAFSAIFMGTGVLLYLVMWLIVPEGDSIVVTDAPKKAPAKKAPAKKAPAAKKSSTTKKSS